MTFRRNGRTINIPVKRAAPRLPATETESRPLLEERTDDVPADLIPEKALSDTQTEARVEISPARDEIENIRQRAERRARTQIDQERRRLLTRLLTVADNLERALAHANEVDPLYQGVCLTLQDLRAQLAQESVEPIHALGQPFDPNLHEAVATDGSGGDQVIQVLQTGYTLEGELLRPARVVVGSVA